MNDGEENLEQKSKDQESEPVIQSEKMTEKEQVNAPKLEKKPSICGKRAKRLQQERRCDHKDMPHYSDGLCKKCYLSRYYLLRKKKNMEKQEELKQKLQAKTAEEKNTSADPQI